MPAANQLLLQTKFHRPRLPHDLIERTRLIQWLNDGISHPLTLVCGPAGYGKTMLICTWLDRLAAHRDQESPFMPSAWLSLDEDESDLNQFLRYFIAALRTIFPETCNETLMLLQASQQPPEELLYITVCNDLAKLAGEVILVLDDYQFIRGKAVHGLLAELARHWPAHLHLVLISRIDPPLPLIKLRAQGSLREIRTQDLRFTPEETATYLSQAQFMTLRMSTLDLLEERFEGWPAGLHLAALSMRSAASQESVQQALLDENTNITGYLLDEVLTHQFPAIYAFLLKTSILDRFSTALCEAVIGESDTAWNVRACLEWIERSELFLISLDNRREWYRYHHLFQQFLRQRLAAEMTSAEMNTLHRRASAWFEENGLIEEALQHALAAGDFDLAARQMSAGLRDALNREDRQTLERWLRMLPDEIVQRHPGLLIIKAWVLQFTWRLGLQAQVLLQVDELLQTGAADLLSADDLQLLHAQIILLRAQQAYFINQLTHSIDLCQQALTLLPPSWSFGRGGAMLYLGLSMQASGQMQEVVSLLLAEYESCSDKADICALFILDSLCYIYLFSGQLEQNRQVAQLLVQGATRSGILNMRSIAEWHLGVVSYQHNELEAAADHFTHLIENHFRTLVINYRDALAGRAFVYQLQGQSAEAWQLVDSISRFDLEQSGVEDPRTRSTRARLQLMQGDLEGAGRWVDTFTGLPPDQPLTWLEEPEVTRVRVLVARGGDADLALALQIMDVLDEIIERTHNLRYKVINLAMRACTLESLSRRTTPPAEAEATHRADLVLKQAVDLGRQGGFIRAFVDLGAPMQAMLQRLASQGYQVEYIHRILAAFPEGEGEIRRQSMAQPPPRQQPEIAALAEPLTRRELEVLALLRGSASIKEIAQMLNISYGTAKGYTINLYSKLGVNRRRDAVARAEELNLLPPR